MLTRPLRPVVLTLALAVLVASGLTVAPADSAAAAYGGSSRVSLPLTSADGRATVLAFAAAHGLAVVHSGPTIVELEGDTSRLASLFGTTMRSRAVRGKQVRAHTRPLVTPSALRSAVGTPVGLSDEPVMRPHTQAAGYTPTEMKHAYSLSTASTAGTGITVATLQFSDWHPTDLDTYASAFGITPAPGQITTLRVGDPDTITTDDNGAAEVALDTEALLATAPRAKQRIYIAGNTGSDILAAYDALLADAQANLVQVASVSWGNCEDRIDSLIPPIHSIIQGIVAAGATLAASTGDLGSSDCGTKTVDYPASDPNTVGVGGTSLSEPTPSQSAWTETGWNGSGGGLSARYSRPAYQASAASPGTQRVVPDVSSDGDAETGLRVFLNGTWVKGGGTSLAAPTWAGGLASALSAAGCKQGVGDVHSLLYAHPEAMRDVTSGSNGDYSARAGYDEVTGLGSPLWNKLAPLLTTTCRPSTFTSVTPSRILDTREGTGRPLGEGGHVALTVTGRAGVPSTGVSAVVLNVTAVDGTADSFLTVYRDGSSRPTASNVNFRGSQDVPNLVTVRPGTNGRVVIFNKHGSTHVVADVQGYYSTSASGARYTPMAPARILDTRPGKPLGPNLTLTLSVAGRAGIPTTGVSAVLFNVTATGPTASSFLTVYPSDAPKMPPVSNLNFSAHQTIPNLVSAKLGADGKVKIYNHRGQTDVVVDVAGYYSSVGKRFVPLRAGRVLDTRDGTGGRGTVLGPNSSFSLLVAGRAGVPLSAAAVLANVTATGATRDTYVTVYPSTKPEASNLNVVAGRTVANLTSDMLSNKRVRLYNHSGSTDLIFDVAGYFVP